MSDEAYPVNKVNPMQHMHELSKKEPPMKVSERIRQRLKEAEMSFFANDSIAQFIEPGEIEELKAEAAKVIENLLDTLVIDREHDHNTKDTAERVAKMYIEEVMMGRYSKTPKLTAFPNVKKVDEIYVVGPIKIRSMCSHHLVPIIGDIWVGVIPGENLIGLSKFNRLAHWIMSRPSIQEESTHMLADALEKEIQPLGLAIVMRAAHLCCSWRGVKDNSEMTTSVMRGLFSKNPGAKTEFMELIKGHGF